MTTYQPLIKSVLYSSLFIISVFSFVGCGSDQAVDTTQLAAAQIKPVENTKENDRQFLVRAVEMKYEQILIGKLAQQRSSSEEVKALAKKLEEASRTEKSSLASLGIIKSISVPAAPTQSAHDAYNKLNEALVEEFDISYIRMAVQGHQDLITHFENATRGKIDPEIQSRASSMLTDMRNHLALAKEIDSRINPVSEVTK